MVTLPFLEGSTRFTLGSCFRWLSEDLVVKPRRDRERERRITMEIVVDAYVSHERAMGWYYYLQEQLKFPFTAICTAKRAISPLRVRDEVQVVGMPSEDECQHEMFVTIGWGRKLWRCPWPN